MTREPYFKWEPRHFAWLFAHASEDKTLAELRDEFYNRFGDAPRHRALQQKSCRLKLPCKNAGQFAKGHTPKNKQTIGAESKANNVIYVRVTDEKGAFFKTHRRKNIVEYEKLHGYAPDPDKTVIVHLNGDSADCSKENMRAVPRKVFCRFSITVENKDVPSLSAAALDYYTLVQELKKKGVI